MTGLPFVWAFWAGRPDAADAGMVARLQDAAEQGMANTDQIAAAYCPGDPIRIAVAQRYLRENLTFRLTGRALDGLTDVLPGGRAARSRAGRRRDRVLPAGGARSA